MSTSKIRRDNPLNFKHINKRSEKKTKDSLVTATVKRGRSPAPNPASQRAWGKMWRLGVSRAGGRTSAASPLDRAVAQSGCPPPRPIADLGSIRMRSPWSRGLEGATLIGWTAEVGRIRDHVPSRRGRHRRPAAFHLWKWRFLRRITLGPEDGETMPGQDEAPEETLVEAVAVLKCKSIEIWVLAA
ncbi:hypothetical protein JTE90_022916 [Oedothorax gibbosus]|uniref:Uncharacterized protein n=1 Tax=Oedothorax gibbosus TaxID=931172 RepID=A0AAV6TET4_9ARAC|nr:hypothetical protein JTE90_022916 [Oedothorax gibbosus]